MAAVEAADAAGAGRSAAAAERGVEAGKADALGTGLVVAALTTTCRQLREHTSHASHTSPGGTQVMAGPEKATSHPLCNAANAGSLMCDPV